MGNKTKVLLLNLPTNIEDISDYNGVIQPFGLAMISSYLKLKGCNVTLLDAQAYHMKREKILRYIQELNPKLIGLPLMTNHLSQTLPFLRDAKRLIPGIITVVGGPHPSAGYKDLLQNHNEVDIAVIGEGEYTLQEIIENIQQDTPLDRIKGVAYRYNDQIRVNPFRDFIQDLDSLPFADWESLPMKNYWDAWTIKKNYVNMILSRGCVFSCTFCGAKNALGNKWRKRSPGHILEEIRLLYDRHNVRNLLFSDSTFNIDNQWVNEICEGILRMDRPLLWGCNIRADTINRETIKLMRKSGCVKLFIGVESADNRMLKNMKKGNSIEKIIDGIRLLNEYGLTPDCGFIIGMPGETEESIKKTIEFAKSLKGSICTFSLAAPFPGQNFMKQQKKRV